MVLLPFYIMVLRPLKYGVSIILTFKFSKLSIWY